MYKTGKRKRIIWKRR